MLRDASHQQVIEKFSFIYSLTLSGAVDSTQQKLTEELTVDRYKFLERSSTLAATSAKLKSEDLVHPSSSSLVASPEIASIINSQGDEANSRQNLAEIVKFSPADTAKDFSPTKPNYLGKIFFACSCCYLIFVIWWLFGEQSGQLLAMLTGKQQIFLSQSDAEFIDYAERSLAAIERKAQASKPLEPDSATESEVVYVPVYTSTPATPQISSSLPTISSPNATAIAPAPPPPPSAAKIPTPPPLPAPTPMPKSPSLETSVVATTVSKPAIDHTLIGILELGDKSAALFKVKGMTKRIWLGEEINNSGWILESVDNQTAQISHQGTTRTLSVGETF